MRRGEVWWGRPALPGGSHKRRPFLIVSHDAFNRNERYPKVMVVHLTSVRRGAGEYPWEVDLPRGAAGLPAASAAKCGEIYTLLKTQLVELAGALRTEHMDDVDRALATALGLRARGQCRRRVHRRRRPGARPARSQGGALDGRHGRRTSARDAAAGRRRGARTRPDGRSMGR